VDQFRDPFIKTWLNLSKETLPQLYCAEDEERRLLPKRQTAGWRNERKGQTKDRLQRSQTISHRLLFLSLYDQMKTKSGDSYPKDKLLDGGMRGKDKQRTGYREVRQYHTDIYFLACLHDQM
jgi:hypothetical protein